MGTYLPRCQHYGAEHVWSVNAWHSTPINYSFVLLQLFLLECFFLVVVLQFIQLVCFSVCMHLVDHWKRGTDLTSRMPAKLKAFQHQTRALPGPLHLDKVFVSERSQTKNDLCVGKYGVWGDFPTLHMHIQIHAHGIFVLLDTEKTH